MPTGHAFQAYAFIFTEDMPGHVTQETYIEHLPVSLEVSRSFQRKGTRAKRHSTAKHSARTSSSREHSQDKQ